MILTHGANSLVRGKYVEIGGRRYPVVKIGNQLWIAENLDFVLPNMTVGDTTVDSNKLQAWYLDNDETTYGWNGQRRGLLYSGYTVERMNAMTGLFPDGWRIPTRQDFIDFIAGIGSSNYLQYNNPGGDGYGSWTGTNETGFNCKPTGYNSSATSFSDKNTLGLLWSSTEYYHETLTGAYFYSTHHPERNNHYKNRSAAIRLVKDAP